MSLDYGTWTDQLGRDHKAALIARDGSRIVVEIDDKYPITVDPTELHH